VSIDLEIAKSNLVFRTLVHTADQNYCVARWARQNEFYIDFAWSSVHALEKYLKAILLLNGQAVINFSHDVVGLWRTAKSVAGDLLPDRLTPHFNVPGHIDVKPVETFDFLSFLYVFGSADARYGTAGHYVTIGDLFHLDTLIYSTRRLLCPLDQQLDGSPDNITCRDWLTNNPRQLLSRRGCLWEKISSASPAEIGSVANCNLAFTNSQTQHDWSWVVSSWHETPYGRDIFGALQSDDRDWAMRGAALSEWILDNMKVDKGFKSEVAKLMTEAKRKHRF
jgi:hypothetical protein